MPFCHLKLRYFNFSKNEFAKSINSHKLRLFNRVIFNASWRTRFALIFQRVSFGCNTTFLVKSLDSVNIRFISIDQRSSAFYSKFRFYYKCLHILQYHLHQDTLHFEPRLSPETLSQGLQVGAKLTLEHMQIRFHG